MGRFSVIIFMLLSSISSPMEAWAQPAARRVRTFTRGDYIYVTQEAALELTAWADGPNDKVAIRICSREPMPVGLATYGKTPFYILFYLDNYGFPRERVLFLRSPECMGSDPAISMTEFWAIPQGAALPASVETIKSCQAHYEFIDPEKPVNSEADYRAELEQLIVKLRERTEATGVVIGYYDKKPTRMMTRRVRVARRLLDQSGLPKDRYFVRLMVWPGEYDQSAPEAEHTYPDVSMIQIKGDCY